MKWLKQQSQVNFEDIPSGDNPRRTYHMALWIPPMNKWWTIEPGKAYERDTAYSVYRPVVDAWLDMYGVDIGKRRAKGLETIRLVPADMIVEYAVDEKTIQA